MIFNLIMFFMLSASFVYCLTKISDTDDDMMIPLTMALMIGTILSIIALIGSPILAAEFNNKLLQMRMNPQNFSIQEANSVNEKLIHISYWQNSIFSYYKNIDTTFLDLSKFVPI